MTRIRNVRRTTKFKRSIKAISPVIATLLMIAIAVVASLVVYAWVTGYIGGSTTKAGKAIQIPSFAVDGSNDLHVYVQNVGQGTVQLSAVYVNDVLKLSPIDVIAEGSTFDIRIPGPYDANAKLNIKVTTTEGTFMTATGTPGSNTNPAVSPTPGPSATATPTPVPTTTPTPTPAPTTVPTLDHFIFETITSPKTSGTAFSITIRAIDQYGAAFTSYTGTNTLTVSAGTISPTSTPAFSAGVWTGSVTLTQSGSGISISTAGGGKTGQSNTFTVNNPFGLDGKISGTGTTSLTLTLSTTFTNDVLYVCVDTYSTSSATVTSSGLTWTRRAFVTTGNVREETWYAIKAGSGSTTINIAVTGNSYTAAVAFGVSGANTASPFDVTNAVTNSGTGTSASASITTTNANDFIIGAVGIDGTGTVNVGSGYTLILTQANTNREISTEYDASNSAGSNTVNFSLSSDTWGIIADAIKQAP